MSYDLRIAVKVAGADEDMYAVKRLHHSGPV